MPDRRVAIVGGGAAGVSAALAAVAGGASVTLVARAPGATSLYSGAMEIAPAPAALEALPHHPLSRLGMDVPRLAAELEEACSTFIAALGRAGLVLRGGPRESGMYADVRGTPATANIVPATVARGELSSLRGRRVAVVGVPAAGEYDAESTATALRELAGVDAEAVDCPLEGLGAGASITDLFGRPAPRPPARAEAVAYPPGFVDLPENGFELLATAPSPHGWRLQQALEAALDAAGVEVRKATVSAFEAEGDRVTAIGAGEDVIAADAVVLAGGRFIGGGLQKSRSIREPLFGLDVFFDGRPADEQAVTLHHLEYLTPEPAFRAGLLTDPQLRPLGRDGRPPFANLRAAGAILGGRDYKDGFGFGVPLLTGRLAGIWSARA